jgi:ketosteroid isomerase-like protein
MTDDNDSANVQVVRKYFEICDGLTQGDLDALFTPDVEIYLPKYGIERGSGVLFKFIALAAETFQRIIHHIDEFRLLEIGDSVVVEGTTEGTMATGLTWDGRATLGGRFCSVFEFHRGLISRMYIYADPDYCSQDSGRYSFFQDDSAYR